MLAPRIQAVSPLSRREQVTCEVTNQSRSIDYAQRAAADYVTRAKKALYAFPASDARDALMYLPDYVISRDR